MITTIKRGTPRGSILKILKEHPTKVKYIDLKKYCGILKLKADPLDLQKEWRNEWK